MATVAELIKQKEALEQQIAAAREAEIADAVAKVKALVEAHNLTAKDIFGGAKRGRKAKSGGSVAIKYKDPLSGATWTGRGREPVWIKGKDRNQFAV